MVCVQLKILYSFVCMQILLEELPVDVTTRFRTLRCLGNSSHRCVREGRCVGVWVWTCECGCGGAILTLHAFCVCADLCVVWCEIMRFTGAHL